MSLLSNYLSLDNQYFSAHIFTNVAQPSNGKTGDCGPDQLWFRLNTTTPLELCAVTVTMSGDVALYDRVPYSARTDLLASITGATDYNNDGITEFSVSGTRVDPEIRPSENKIVWQYLNAGVPETFMVNDGFSVAILTQPIDDPNPDAGSITGTANFYTNCDPANLQFEPASATRSFSNCTTPTDPDFTITKTATPTTLAQGDSVQYQVTVQNTGGEATNVTVTDVFPIDKTGDHDAKLTGCAISSCTFNSGSCDTSFNGTNDTVFNHSVASWPNGQTLTLNYACTSDTTDMTDGSSDTIENTVTVNWPGALAPKQAFATVTINKESIPVLTISKNAVPQANPLRHDQSVQYSIVVNNNSGTEATEVNITDVRSPGTNSANMICANSFNCTGSLAICSGITGAWPSGLDIESFPNNESVTITYTCTADTSAMDYSTTGSITNTATITWTGGSDDDQAIVELTKDSGPYFTITKAVDKPILQHGETVNYNINISNTGGEAGEYVSITDNLGDDPVGANGASMTCSNYQCTGATCPSSWVGVFPITIASFPVGTTITFSYSCTANTDNLTASSDTIVNTASVAWDDKENDDTAQVVINAPPMDITINKTADKYILKNGDEVNYHVQVSNSGRALTNVKITDNMPGQMSGVDGAGLNCIFTAPSSPECMHDYTDPNDLIVTCATFDKNQIVDINYACTAVVPDTLTGFVPIENTASLFVANSLIDEARVTVNLLPSEHEFLITKSANRLNLQHNQTVTYAINVINGGDTSSAIINDQ